jgi:geranylgeranyl diphosphate synthase type II
MNATSDIQHKASEFDLPSYLASKRKQINIALENILGSSSHSSRILQAMKYSIMAGGKRLRPILCLAATETVGGKLKRALPAACALEMIHTYSLIHDDLPAIDDDELRRGKPTSHIAFDEATAILAGDALLTLAFETLSSIDPMPEKHAIDWLHVVQVISKAAGYAGMIEGQMRDLTAEGQHLSLDELQKIHSLKTGALIEASICSGAILGNGTSEQLEKLRFYAKNIGLAFQVTDDILNVEGDPAVMGKSVGTDASRNKSTYPSLLGTDQSKTYAANLINDALQALDVFDNKSDPLRAIANYILQRRR